MARTWRASPRPRRTTTWASPASRGTFGSSRSGPSAECGGSLSDIAEAIRWAAGLPVPGVPLNPTPARVISLSLGGSEPCVNTVTMQGSIDAALAAGSVVIAATGNESNTALISPANCSGTIAVTAHTINGENADYANIGAATAISAPGGGSPVQLGPAAAPTTRTGTGTTSGRPCCSAPPRRPAAIRKDDRARLWRVHGDERGNAARGRGRRVDQVDPAFRHARRRSAISS